MAELDDAPPESPPSAYLELSPPRHLHKHVVCFWQRPAGAVATNARVIPDGCIDVIWRNDRPPVVAGPMTAPIAPALAAGTAIVGVRFRPGIAPFLFGVSARELVDQHVALEDVWPQARHLSWGAASDHLPANLADIEAAITARLAAGGDSDPFIARAASWIAHHPAGRIDALGELSGLSERQIRRRFDEAIGYGPKTLQRIMRVQRLLWLASQDPGRAPSLSRLSFAAGYADQPHMTREVVALTGASPGQILLASAPRSAVADLFKTPAH